MFLNRIEAGGRVAAEELPVSGLRSQSPTEANTIPTDLSRCTLTPEATKDGQELFTVPCIGLLIVDVLCQRRKTGNRHSHSLKFEPHRHYFGLIGSCE